MFVIPVVGVIIMQELSKAATFFDLLTWDYTPNWL